MSHDVLLEICVLTESFPANRTKERLFSTVCPHMILQRGIHCETLATEFALILNRPAVSLLSMRLKFFRFRERLCTFATLERLRMRFYVFNQAFIIDEHFFAELTNELLFRAFIDLHMTLE